MSKVAWVPVNEMQLEAISFAVRKAHEGRRDTLCEDYLRRAYEAMNALDDPSQEKLVKAARGQYAVGNNDDVEVDENAARSQADEGTWVQMWGWVNHEELDKEGADARRR
jgi:hypothetical protein